MKKELIKNQVYYQQGGEMSNILLDMEWRFYCHIFNT